VPDQRSCIGIDLGTSGCRGISIDTHGNILASSHYPLPATRSPHPGWMEQSPQDWWLATLAVIQDLLNATTGYNTATLSVDGTSSTLLLTDVQGKPLTPGLMYNDRRSTTECQWLAGHAPQESAVLSPSSSLSKLLWLQKHYSLNNAHALHQSEWISARLCQNFSSGDEHNCLKLGYDPVERCWPEWMQHLTLPPAILPKVQPMGTAIGNISPDMAEKTGLSGDCKIIAGTTDSTAAALAAGIRIPGEAVTSLGSTLVCKVLSDQPVFNAGYGVYSHRIGDQWLTGGASNSGGSVLRQHFSDNELDDLSRQIDPHRSLCLDYYPLLTPGERFPTHNPDMLPRLTPVPTDRKRFLQGVLEGISRIEKTAYQRLHSLGAPLPDKILSSGGGANNPIWIQMRARILGIPVLAATHQQAAFGAAGVALRWLNDQIRRQ
jgi:sugar (pentulose or hexulose) kinase